MQSLLNWLDDTILYIYALSLVFYCADLIGRHAYAKRTGTGLLAFVWVLQAVFFLSRNSHREYVPIVTMFETMFFFSWVLVTFALVLLILFRQDVAAFLMSLPGFAVLLFGYFGDPLLTPASFETNELNGGLLIVHIALAISSYALFTLSAVFSMMYLFLHRKLKGKLWSASLRRLPSLHHVETYAYRTAAIGFGLLFVSFVVGACWIWLRDQLQLIYDPKVLLTLFLLGIYIVYFMFRRSLKLSGRKLALWNLTGYAVILLNFMLSNYISEFHDWIWMW